MPRYIDANKIKFLGESFDDADGDALVSLSDVRKAIEQTPTADVVEIRHGMWLMCLTDEPWRKGYHGRCSECGASYTYNINKMPRRCNNCDALMDGKENKQ